MTGQIQVRRAYRYIGGIHWDVILGQWTIGWVCRNIRDHRHHAYMTGRQYGEGAPLLRSNCVSLEEARDAIIEEFSRRTGFVIALRPRPVQQSLFVN
jgi:hypothetical protein